MEFLASIIDLRTKSGFASAFNSWSRNLLVICRKVSEDMLSDSDSLKTTHTKSNDLSQGIWIYFGTHLDFLSTTITLWKPQYLIVKFYCAIFYKRYMRKYYLQGWKLYWSMEFPKLSSYPHPKIHQLRKYLTNQIKI